MTEAKNLLIDPGLIIDSEMATRAFRGLSTREPTFSKQVVYNLKEHLGVNSSETSSPSETIAVSALIALADMQIKAQTPPEKIKQARLELFTVQEGETATATFNRLLNFVIENHRR